MVKLIEGDPSYSLQTHWRDTLERYTLTLELNPRLNKVQLKALSYLFFNCRARQGLATPILCLQLPLELECATRIVVEVFNKSMCM